MLVADSDSLTPVKILVSNSFVHIELFQNKNGNLFLSSVTHKPGGIVYYATTPSLFCAFLENSVTLQDLLDETPSLFVEIKSKEKKALYSLNDSDIELACGDKTIQQLTGVNPIEVWEGMCGDQDAR